MVNLKIIITVIVITVVLGFLFYPNDEPSNTIMFETSNTNESKIKVGDVEFLVSNDDIVDVTIFDQLLSEPDVTIPIDSELPLSFLNEVQYSFEEDVIADKEIAVNKYELTTSITYNDGSESEQSNFVDLQALDFLTLDNEQKEFDKGKLSFKLSVPINEQIRLAQSEFTVNFIDSNNNVKTIKNIFNKKTQSDVKDGMIVFLDEDIQFESILNITPIGINKLTLTLDKLFIIYDNNSREYASPKTLYSSIIEKSDSLTIITTETGTAKIWDSDLPLTISTSTQSVTAKTCVTSSSTGCTKYFESYYKVASPQLGQITIVDLKTNNEIVRTDVVSESSCINKLDSKEINLCKQVGQGTKFTFMLQRDSSYNVKIGSPQNESFVINTPENYKEYEFNSLTATIESKIPSTQEWCSKQSGKGYNGVTYNGNTVNSMGKVVNAHQNLGETGQCLVRYNISNGQSWYNYDWKTVEHFEYHDELISNFP